MVIAELKEGVYTGRELCNMVKYDHNKFKNNSNTLLERLKQVCNIEKVGKGKGSKWKISNIKTNKLYMFDINKYKRCEESKHSKLHTKIEIENGFDGFYAYRHIANDKVMYVGKGCKRRASEFVGRKYNRLDIDDIEIVKRFEDEIESLKFEEQLINYY